MACACKNKIKKVDRLVPDGEPQEPQSKITKVFLKVIGRMLLVILGLVILPIAMVLIFFKLVFIPEKQIIINLNKMTEKWKKITE